MGFNPVLNETFLNMQLLVSSFWRLDIKLDIIRATYICFAVNFLKTPEKVF